MISISEMKAKVKTLVEDLTGLKAYFDLVPNNIRLLSFPAELLMEMHTLPITALRCLSSRFKAQRPVTLRRISWLMPLTGNIQKTSDSLW